MLLDGYLGVDSSLRAPGVVLLNREGELVRSRTISVSSRLRGGERLHRIRSEFIEFLQGDEVVAAAIEGYSVGSTDRPFDLGSAFGVFQGYIYERYKIEAKVVPPSSLKLFVTGNGGADKDFVLSTVKKRWGQDFKDRDDEADAFGLARFAWAVHTRHFDHRWEAEAAHALSPAAAIAKRPRRSTTPNI